MMDNDPLAIPLLLLKVLFGGIALWVLLYTVAHYGGS